MRPQDPFERHPVNEILLQDKAEQLVTFAEQSSDQQAVTDRAFDPAVASWDGIAAPELREAPEPLRKEAQEVALQAAWAAVPLRYWADQVRKFNTKVDDLQKRVDELPAEVERRLRERFGDDLMDLERGPEFPSARSVIRGEILHELEQEWHTALSAHIDDGEQTTTDMFRNGPTWGNLERAQAVGALPSGGTADFFAAEWGRAAALEEAERIAGGITDPDYITTHPDLQRFAKILETYADDDQFSYEFLTTLGPDGLLVLTGEVGLLGQGWVIESWPEMLGTIQAGLATMLATATARRGTGGGSPHSSYMPGAYELPEEWIYELTQVGRDQLAIGGSTHVYGYQPLGVLLSRGGYDDHFLSVVGSDMIDFEMEHGGKRVWFTADGYPERLNWLEPPTDETAPPVDPMVGLMEALTYNPEATREILTSRVVYNEDHPNGHLARLGYLLTDREWLLEASRGPGSDLLPTEFSDAGIRALGTALERATTEEPDERSHQIVESIIYEIANDEQVKGYPNDPTGQGNEEGNQALGFDQVDIVSDALRPYLGRIAAEYVDDLHWSMVGRIDTDEALPGEQHVTVADDDLEIFFAELGKNAEARDTVMLAEDFYTAALYDHFFSGTGNHTELWEQLNAVEGTVLSPAAQIFGALDYGAVTEIDNEWNEQAEGYNQALRDRYFLGELAVKAAQDARMPDSIGALVEYHLNGSENENRAVHVGDADFEGRTLRELGRERLMDQVRQAAYRNLDPADLPGGVRDYLVDEEGRLKPMDEWIDDPDRPEYEAWNRYLSNDGAHFPGWLENEARRSYDDEFDAAQSAIAGSSLPRRG